MRCVCVFPSELAKYLKAITLLMKNCLKKTARDFTRRASHFRKYKSIDYSGRYGIMIADSQFVLVDLETHSQRFINIFPL